MTRKLTPNTAKGRLVLLNALSTLFWSTLISESEHAFSVITKNIKIAFLILIFLLIRMEGLIHLQMDFVKTVHYQA